MITVAWKAKKHLLAVLEHVELLEGATLRLESNGRYDRAGMPEVVMCAGMPDERDQVVEHQGDVLLCVARMVSAAYDGCVLDVVRTSDGIRLSLAAPEVGREAL